MAAHDKSSFKVIIVGAGLAGCCLANGLMRHDIDVQVFERLSREAKREGYQIRLGAHALRGLRACLAQDQLQAIVDKFGPANGGKSEAPGVYNKNFDLLLDLSAIPSYNKSAPISRLVLRDALAAPIDSAGRLTYGAQFDRYEILASDTPNERVRAWFDDGSHHDCDVLIAADGSHSKVNQQIGLRNIHVIQGLTSMLAKNELPTERYLQLSQRLQKRQVLAFADAKSLYFSGLITDRQIVSPVDFDSVLAEKSGPRRHENMATLPSDVKWKVVSDILHRSQWASEYHELVNLVKETDLYVYRGRYSTQPSMNWRSKVRSINEPELGHSRIWVIGDAMHAMLPNRGMGGNTAMYDTATVLPLLVRLSTTATPNGRVSTENVAQACREYEAEMIPRAFAWVRKSGGGNMVPVDASTWSGVIFLRLAAVAFSVASAWYTVLGMFTSQQYVDDAPELRDQ